MVGFCPFQNLCWHSGANITSIALGGGPLVPGEAMSAPPWQVGPLLHQRAFRSSRFLFVLPCQMTQQEVPFCVDAIA